MTMMTPPHPGSLITEYLEDYNVSLRTLAGNLGVSPSALSKAAAGKTAITPEMAVRLEAGLGIAARLWLSMQATYDISRVRETIDITQVVPARYGDMEGQPVKNGG
ncbi:HigA family addiction module antitoxin [Erwinia sp. AnSW2-5]|uniref:HigA family addiction module antitoxin n=1 Tax=Erwinia sp. AnSW2-5 TaxID=3367692 RepID=UPI00385D5F41